MIEAREFTKSVTAKSTAEGKERDLAQTVRALEQLAGKLMYVLGAVGPGWSDAESQRDLISVTRGYIDRLRSVESCLVAAIEYVNDLRLAMGAEDAPKS